MAAWNGNSGMPPPLGEAEDASESKNVPDFPSLLVSPAYVAMIAIREAGADAAYLTEHEPEERVQDGDGEKLPSPPVDQVTTPDGENPAIDAVHVVGTSTSTSDGEQDTVAEVFAFPTSNAKDQLFGGLLESPL